MFAKPSLAGRVAIGKGIGFLIGLAGFMVIPYIWADASLQFRLGILFWYATLGAIVGMVGVWTRHPVLNFPMPWFIRAPIAGAWMNFVLTLFLEDQLQTMLEALMGSEGVMTTPYWFVLEGALVAALIGWLATRICGEGAETSTH